MAPLLPLVAAAGLTKRYGAFTAVADLTLELHDNTCVGLLGPNGAGKSTFIGMLTGTTVPSAGALELFGVPHQHLDATTRARLALVPQDHSLDPELTVWHNLATTARYYGIPAAEARARIQGLLGLVQLHDKAAVYGRALSGGMRRRLAIARALLPNPSLLILDEPTTGLDPQNRYLIWQHIVALKKAGKTFLLSTHDMEEAQRLCDRVLIMHQGKIMADGAPLTLLEQHVEPHVFEVPKAAASPELRRAPMIREEVAGSLFFYVREPRAMQPFLRGGIPHMQRSAHLGDVFLRLTGRALHGE